MITGLIACALSRLDYHPEWAGGLENTASRGVGSGAGDGGRVALVPVVPLDWTGPAGGMLRFILL